MVENGRVYALGAMGDLMCLNADNGKVIWEKKLNRVLQGRPLRDMAPMLGRIIGDEAIGRPTKPGEYTAEHPMSRAYPETGLPKRPATNISQPNLVGDTLFVSFFYHGPLGLKLAKDKAEVLYRGKDVPNPLKAPVLHTLMSTPGEKDGLLYGTGSGGDVQCVDPKTGKTLWKDQKPFGGKEAVFGTAFFIRHGERFFLFTDQGDLILANLSPKGYEEISRANILKPSQSARGRDVVWCHPAFAGQCMYVRNDKEIVCVELAKT